MRRMFKNLELYISEDYKGIHFRETASIAYHTLQGDTMQVGHIVQQLYNRMNRSIQRRKDAFDIITSEKLIEFYTDVFEDIMRLPNSPYDDENLADKLRAKFMSMRFIANYEEGKWTPKTIEELLGLFEKKD